MKNFEDLKNYIIKKKHHIHRREVDIELACQFSNDKISLVDRMAYRFNLLCKSEMPIILKDERITLLRTISNIPEILTIEEWEDIKSEYFVHENGFLSNLTPNYAKLIKNGLDYFYNDADTHQKQAIDSIYELCLRYRDKAKECDNEEIYQMFCHIPMRGARSFHESLQFFRIIHYFMWLEGSYHITVGRLDQYLYPYLETDLEKGVIDNEEAQSLLTEFFLTFNRDNDLYIGVQQGDNGQSIVLGGVDSNGEQAFNSLSQMCLKASAELKLIDPKINIRASKETPDYVYTLGTELTKIGLGFPQYTNDDIVVPALVKLGYDLEDARNYSIAACWETIIPNVGRDIANIGALSFVKVIDNCLHNNLDSSQNMDEFLDYVKLEINNQCKKICDNISDVFIMPTPFMELAMDFDSNKLGKYNNYGIHGTGLANASDSLCAISKYVFSEKLLTASELIKAVDSDFESNPELLHKLRYETPKVGQNDDECDRFLVELLDMFSNGLKDKRTRLGDRFRAGTGSAMFYLWHVDEIGASPDGRRKGEPLGTNFSVSLFAKNLGPMSIIMSMTKPNFEDVMNGGPLTLEFASSMWKTQEDVKTFAKFIKSYITLGGHQIQLNSINQEILRDAQLNPQNHPHLIVRIWGWSAYYVELQKEYQDHVLKRQEYKL